VNSERYIEGIKLFNSTEFFDAHEALEDVWRAAPEPEKKFLQGLIQVAVALHHHSKGNLVGARSLLERATRNLAVYPESFAGVNLSALLHELSEWRRYLKDGGSCVPPLPKI
jgi:predicted metal-dependent hydrolase